jgi:hypothetical protein
MSHDWDREAIQQIEGKRKMVSPGSVEFATASTPVSATESNFQDLQQNLKSLNESIYLISERLSPILFESDTVSVPTDPGKDYPGPTGVSDRLAMLCRETDMLIGRLNTLLHRIDL